MDNIPNQEEFRKMLVQRHGAAYVEKLRKAHVAIAGLGGLGSNIAISLARAGVGCLDIIDFDTVCISNLHRQQYMVQDIGRKKAIVMKEKLRNINPYIDIKTNCVKVNEDNAHEIFQRSDYIVEAFDVPECKAFLVNFILENYPNKFVVASSGMAGIGDGNKIVTRRITNNLWICGDGVSGIDEGVSLFAARVAICANHQALKTIQLILENEK